MKVAYQGTKASFSEIAIARFFDGDAVAIGKETFEEVFESLEKREVELAAVPIENSLIGPIVENFDLFHQCQVTIFGELCMAVEHCLVGKKGQEIGQIKKGLSHPKALAQCMAFFREHLWIEPIVHFDTAGAVEEISRQPDPTLAAIGSRKTAEVYGLEVLKTHLEDNPSNTTRFLFLQKTVSQKLTEGKCSVLFTLPHASGALSQVLQILADHRLNLTQIVSRPVREKPFEYLFFVDMLFSQDNNLESILSEIAAKTILLKVLGVYAPST